MTRVRPSIWLPCLEIIWGGQSALCYRLARFHLIKLAVRRSLGLTGAVAGCSSAKGIYAIRVLLGLAEASAYPGGEPAILTLNGFQGSEFEA
jgi:hypothetical protein